MKSLVGIVLSLGTTLAWAGEAIVLGTATDHLVMRQIAVPVGMEAVEVIGGSAAGWGRVIGDNLQRLRPDQGSQKSSR